ncbi:MAG TPA: lysylphosphatidylglycerol synthase domain-containing protein [Solirubrobacteraceae bacterium]|jgi:uncharacterized membrane protein YbhN (UPF0104 family)
MSATADERSDADRDANRLAELTPRHIWRRLIELAVLLGLVAFAVSSLPGLGTLRERFSHADALWLVLIGVFKLGSCISNVVAFREVFGRRLRWRFSYQLGMAEQAANVLVPTGGAGGLALGAWALHQGGMRTDHIARRSVAFFVITSVPNFICAAVLGPLLLAGVFSGDVPVAATATFTGLAWATIVLAFLLPHMLGRVRSGEGHGRLRRAIDTAARSLSDGLFDSWQMLRSARISLIGGAFGYLFFDIAAFIAAFATFGGVPALGPLIFAYIVGQLGGLIPLPGGIGGTDGGLIGAMVLYGTPLSHAVAGVLAYRAFQLGVPAVLGCIAFVQLRLTLRRSSAPEAMCASLADSLEGVQGS